MSSAPPETAHLPPPAAPTASFQYLTATYTSPTNAPFIHTTNLPSPSSSSTAQRVSYLASLRKATAELQEHINTELTARMEQDKARDVTGAARVAGGVVLDEGKEEDNYGEEVPQDED